MSKRRTGPPEKHKPLFTKTGQPRPKVNEEHLPPLAVDDIVPDARAPFGLRAVVKREGIDAQTLHLPLYGKPFADTTDTGKKVFLAKSFTGRLVQFPANFTEAMVQDLQRRGKELARKDQSTRKRNTGKHRMERKRYEPRG